MFESRIRDFCGSLLITCLLAGTAAAEAAPPRATEKAADGLGAALQATLRNHPAVAGQQAQVIARQYAADGARSERYPTLTAQTARYTSGNRSAASGDDLSNPALLRLRQPIWTFGRINDSVAVADAEVSTQRADLLRVSRQLLEDTAVAYARVRGSHLRVQLAQQNVAEHRELFDQIRRRVAGQLASSADARLAATRLAQARAQLERAISEQDTALQDLAGLTQEALPAEEPVPSALLELRESADLIETAVENSAEIRLARQHLGRAEAEVERARTASMPTVYLQADQFYDQPGLRDDSQVSVVVEASLEGLGLTSRRRRGEAVASRRAATHNLAAARVELRRELARLQRSRQLQAQLIVLQNASLRDLESLLNSYQRQYDSGTKSWLDLMNIQRELIEQRSQLVQARIDWQIHSLQLLARVGGLDDLAGIQERRDG